MFVVSARASTIKFSAVLLSGVLLVCALLFLLPIGEDLPSVESGSYRYDGIKSYEDMEQFLAQFGWQVEKKPLSDEKVTIPSTFNRVYAEYNRLQHAQGLDLSDFAGKKVQKVVFRVTNFEKETPVNATLLIYREHVVGGDLSSTDSEKLCLPFSFEKD